MYSCTCKFVSLEGNIQELGTLQPVHRRKEKRLYLFIKYFILTCKAFSKFSFHEADNVKNLRCQPKSLKS